MSKLIFGCGYLGARAGRRWRASGEQVYVVTRDADRARDLSAEGFVPIVADVLCPATLIDLPAVETVLYAIGYDRAAGASMHDVFVGGLLAVLAALPAETARFVYTSSTGVYGQSQGEWVDERSPCQPRREGGRACLAAEQALQAHPMGQRAIVLRMAGLYGPGRIPQAAEIRRNEPIVAPEEGYLNLIHVDDAVSVVLAAAERAAPPGTYVVSDGHPVQRREYYEELARRLGAPPPRFAAAPSDSPAALRAASNKRAKNARMLAELGVTLAFPSYREALAAIVAADAETSRRP
jgi:nucleoside-diphosphate-sugar epimerase